MVVAGVTFDPHDKARHGFPGATVIYPMSKQNWTAALSYWLPSALLRVCGMLATLEVVIAIFNNAVPYSSWSSLSRFIAYAAIFAFLIECLFVMIRTCTGEQKQAQELFEEHGVLPHLKVLHVLVHFLKSFMLRFFNCPHIILAAPQDCMGTSLPLGGMPIRYWFSDSNFKYDKMSGQYQALPKLILEDLVMFSLKMALLILTYWTTRFVRFSLVIAVITGGIGCMTSSMTTRSYLRVICDSEAEYNVHISRGDHLDVEFRLQNLPMPWFRWLLDGPRGFCFKRDVLRCTFIPPAAAAAQEEDSPVGSEGMKSSNDMVQPLLVST